MANRKAVVEQAKIANLKDDELLNLIGYLWQEIKNIDESMASDDTLKELIEEVKDYKDDTYLTRKGAYVGQLKAARILAKQKGLNFKLPEEQ